MPTYTEEYGNLIFFKPHYYLYFIVCVTTLHGLPNRFARYDQPSSSTHTNSTHEAVNPKDAGGGGGGGSIDIITDDNYDDSNDDKFNNTIHLLDFLSELILNTDPNAGAGGGPSPADNTNNQNISMKLTFEETMQNLDAIISQIDQDLKITNNNNNPPHDINAGVFKQPRLDDSKSPGGAGQISSEMVGGNIESLEKYQALLELKEILDRQFKDFAVDVDKEARSEVNIPTDVVTPIDVETFKDDYQDLIPNDNETKSRDELYFQEKNSYFLICLGNIM